MLGCRVFLETGIVQVLHPRILSPSAITLLPHTWLAPLSL
jgi:hypothetical protein